MWYNGVLRGSAALRPGGAQAGRSGRTTRAKKIMQYGVIMAGGAGTRLWPLSRGGRPKQLLPVVRGKSLLRLSYERLRGVLPQERIYVCTGAAFGPAVMADLPELP